MFYNAHLIQTLCHIMETISDMRQYRSLGHGLIFANTFHHASNRKSLSILFKIYNAVRVLISIFLLLVLIYSQFHVVIVEHDKSQGHKMLEVTSIIILLFQLGVLSYAILWSFLITKKSLWGQLMNVYKRTLDKIDIARGRCVPSPPNQRRAERILDALNPYVSSENIQLVLDLLAYRAGVGVALRTLAHLEIDVQNNWRPFRLGSKVLSNGALEVNWKDPLAVVYLPPSFPSKLRLHYGIEITFTNEHTDMERIVEIIGYDETRYYQQVWNSSRPNSVSDLRSSDSMQYVEVFRGIPSGAHVEIAVWTIVDGMLISRSTKSREQCIPANRVPKPPRTLEGSPSLPKESPTPSDKMESSSSQPEQMNPNQKMDVKSSLCNSCSSSSTSSSDSTCSQDSENCEEDEDDEGTIQEIPHQRFSTSLVSTDSESSILSLDSSHPSETSSTKPLSTLPAKTKSLTNLILQHENETVMRKVRSSESTTNPSSVLPSNIQNKRLFSEFKNNKNSGSHHKNAKNTPTNNNSSSPNSTYMKNPKKRDKKDYRLNPNNSNNFARNTDKRKSLQIGSGYMNYAFENEAEQNNPTVII